jgi:LPS sulfotransferase NodH
MPRGSGRARRSARAAPRPTYSLMPSDSRSKTEFDASNLTYIIAVTPRTGSYLLCEGLEATGIAGRPTEVFSPDFQDIWRERWSLGQNASFAEYLRAALRHGTTSNGVYGLKIHWMHVGRLARDACFPGDCSGVLDHLFPGSQFVNIVRQDQRAQALSYFRALATNEWWRIESIANNQKNATRPAFDAAAVLALEADLAQQQLAWTQYFLKHRLNPLIVEYEALAEDFRGQVARVLRFLGLNDAIARAIPEPRLIRQADDLTLRWRRQMETASNEEVNKRELAPYHRRSGRAIR